MDVNLKTSGDISNEGELKNIFEWNITAVERGFPTIKSVVGTLDTYTGQVDIVFSNGHDIGYFYKIDPSGKFNSDTHLIDISGVQQNSNKIQKFIDYHGSITLGLLKMYESTSAELDDIQNSYKWIKVKQFKESDYETLEERYEALKKHHKEETEFLINKVRELHKQLTK